MAIDGSDEIEPYCQVIQGGCCGKVKEDDFLGLRRGGGGAHGCGDILCPAEVFLPDDLRLSIDAPTFSGVPAGMAADDLLVQADSHALGHTISYTGIMHDSQDSSVTVVP